MGASIKGVEIVHLDSPFLLAIYHPGAFIGLGFYAGHKIPD